MEMGVYRHQWSMTTRLIEHLYIKAQFYKGGQKYTRGLVVYPFQEFQCLGDLDLMSPNYIVNPFPHPPHFPHPCQQNPFSTSERFLLIT